MLKKILCISLIASVIGASLYFQPQADVIVEVNEPVSVEYSDNEDSAPIYDDGNITVYEEQVSEEELKRNENGDSSNDGSATADSGNTTENPDDPYYNEYVDEHTNDDMILDEYEITEEELEEYIPDEPENVVENEADDYFEVEEEYIYDDKPFDASYITGEGVDRIKNVIIAYANSLGGTFRSPYYKGGKAVSVQCCAYVNQVWKHVFGKDIYDSGIMTTMSHEGETIYNFLERTGARAGDILYVRYWKVKKNDWSSHFMILLDYDRTGVYVTDGYETDDGKFVVWRIDKKAIYSESNFFKRTGSDKSKPGSVHYSGRKGSFFKLYRMSQNEWCRVANSSYEEYSDDPFVRTTTTRIDRNDGTFTITAMIHSNNGLDHVQFPVWTVANGSDDLLEDYATNEYASGEIEDMGLDIYKVTYTVNIADHNNECGIYMAEMNIVDNLGVTLNYRCDAIDMDGAVGGVCVDYYPWMLQ